MDWLGYVLPGVVTAVYAGWGLCRFMRRRR